MLFMAVINRAEEVVVNCKQNKGHIQSENDMHRFATVSGVNNMFASKKCAAALRCFLSFGGCITSVTQSAAMCI